MIRKLLLIGGTVALSLTPFVAATAAPAPAPNTSGQALEISPTIKEVSVEPGKSYQVNVQVRNISRSTQAVRAQVDDFTPNGETGLPKIDLDSDGTSQYSFKNWVRLPAPFQIVPREIKSVNLTVNVPANATPGSHYGIIRFTASPPGLSGQGVSISTSVGLLAILRVAGDAQDNLKVAEFSMAKDGKKGKFFESAPVEFVERLRNAGNTDISPTGMVEINNLFGKRVANVAVNQPPRIILPESTRRFTQVLDSQTIGSRVLFGYYTAKLNLTYGEDKKPLVAVIKFWVIPYKLIITILFFLVALVLLVKFLLRRYDIQISTKKRK